MIDAEHEVLWAEAVRKHKSEFHVPRDEVALISEILRGLYVVQIWQSDSPDGKNPLPILNSYSVSDEATKHIIAKLGIKEQGAKGHISNSPKKPETRRSKWAMLENWAQSNAGKEFTTDEIVKKSEFSYQTTLKYISESPLFVKVKKGLWKIPADARQ